jgi:hypothetical protein
MQLRRFNCAFKHCASLLKPTLTTKQRHQPAAVLAGCLQHRPFC